MMGYETQIAPVHFLFFYCYWQKYVKDNRANKVLTLIALISFFITKRTIDTKQATSSLLLKCCFFQSQGMFWERKLIGDIQKIIFCAFPPLHTDVPCKIRFLIFKMSKFPTCQSISHEMTLEKFYFSVLKEMKNFLQGSSFFSLQLVCHSVEPILC